MLDTIPLFDNLSIEIVEHDDTVVAIFIPEHLVPKINQKNSLKLRSKILKYEIFRKQLQALPSSVVSSNGQIVLDDFKMILNFDVMFQEALQHM